MATPEKTAAAAAKPPPPPSASPGKAAGKPTTLLDVHEVEWITRELERLLVRESGGGGGGSEDGHGHHRRRRRKGAKAISHGAAQKPHAKKGGGFLSELLGKHAVSICGDGTVGGAAAAAVSGGRRRGRGGFREVDKV